MKKIILYIVIFLSGLPVLSFAQSERSRRVEVYFRNGEKEFANQRYMYAIPFYRTGLKHPGINDSLANLHMAESYWYVKNYDSALAYYLRFESRYAPLFSTSQRIAELAANHSRYRDAAGIYQKLVKEIPSRNAKLLAERLKGFSNPKPFFRDSLDYSIRLLNLNTKQQDFSPQFYERGMVFVSNRYSKKSSEKEFGWDGLPFANIYWVKDTADLYTTDTVAGYSSRTHNVIPIIANDDYTAQTSNDNDIIVVAGSRSSYNGTIHRLAKFSDELNAKYNYGPLCFNKAGDKVYFTRNNLNPNKGRYNLEICVATQEKGIWGKIHTMPFVQAEYDFYHPALSNDETKLYFCSNKPDGMGGSDIYYVNLTSEYDMSIPYPMDSRINTAGNELFPTIHGDTLYFSSDGFAGLGGLDIYKTYTVRGTWKAPVNVGYPINSSFDDFGIIFNTSNAKGFFTSNRLGTDDIYVFEHNPFTVEMKGTVLSRATMRRLDLAKVILRSDEEDKPVIDSFVTDITGNFHFPVKPGSAYTLLFTRIGYYEDSIHVPNTGTEKLLTLQNMLLTPIPVPAPPPVVEMDRDGDGVPDAVDKCPDVKGPKSNNGCPDVQAEIDALAKMVFFKTASAELSAASMKPLNEVCAYLSKYPNLTLYIEGHTDSRAPAPYNLDLSKRRAKSVRDYFIAKGFAADRFSSAGFGLTRPIADNSMEEGRAMNRRVAIKANFH
jgi:outer membrane protein OmpA-like peptidoglycan-associated protein/tetratricopeptide (TPR) repeat protein